MIDIFNAIDFTLLEFSERDKSFYYKNLLYTGSVKVIESYSNYDILRLSKCFNGKLSGTYKLFYFNSKIIQYPNLSFIGEGSEIMGYDHGYRLAIVDNEIDFRFDESGINVEKILVSSKGNRIEKWSWLILDNPQSIEYQEWDGRREYMIEKGYYSQEGDMDYLPFYNLQNGLREKIIKTNFLKSTIEYIAGVDVAYDENTKKMVGGIVVLNAETLKVVETALHEMEITFPYIPGLFSFREIPPLLEAYKKLTIKPDLIVCDAQGIAHPKGVGMATHLGIELDIPTIGCAKKRLVGYYDKEVLGTKRGDNESLIWDSEEVGRALRTQDNIKPMFVSIGHKISLETACEWVLRLCPTYRLPETTRAVDHLVNQVLKERTNFNLFPEDD
jgi:deoxyribonuclease V